MLDSTEGPTDQDAAIAGEADRAGCGIIAAGNKWDLVKGQGPDFVRTFDEEVRRQLKFLDYAPQRLYLSSRPESTRRSCSRQSTGWRRRARKRVSTGELNRFVEAVTAVHPPASPGRRPSASSTRLRSEVAPPSFVFFTNIATTFHSSYQRFITNQLRESFGFLPIANPASGAVAARPPGQPQGGQGQRQGQ